MVLLVDDIKVVKSLDYVVAVIKVQHSYSEGNGCQEAGFVVCISASYP